MKILSIQEVYRRKFKRQKGIKELKYHASGHCVHIGKVSPGCYGCFVPDQFNRNILTGIKCNLNCVYCGTKSLKEPDKNTAIKEMAIILRDSRLTNYAPRRISFSGGGEPLLYLDKITKYMELFRDIEKDTKKDPGIFFIRTEF